LSSKLTVTITFTDPSIPEYSTVNSTHTHMERERIRLNITWEVCKTNFFFGHVGRLIKYILNPYKRTQVLRLSRMHL